MIGLEGILHRIKSFAVDRRGVSSVEYAVLAVGVIIAVAGAIAAYDMNNPLALAGSVLSSNIPPITSR